MGPYGLSKTHTLSGKTETLTISIFLEWPLDKFNVYFCDKAATDMHPCLLNMISKMIYVCVYRQGSIYIQVTLICQIWKGKEKRFVEVANSSHTTRDKSCY